MMVFPTAMVANRGTATIKVRVKAKVTPNPHSSVNILVLRKRLVAIKLFNFFYDVLYLLVSQCLITWESQHTLIQLLCLW